jgi:hypothetical protein
MAKKSRRARKKTSRNVSEVAVESGGATGAESVADQQAYGYVVADLRQVALLAGVMFALLIGLSFFIG